MNVIYDSNRSGFGKCKEVRNSGRSIIIYRRSSVAIDLNLNFSNKIFIKIVAKTISSKSSINFSIGEYTKTLNVLNNQPQEISVVFNIEDFISSEKLILSCISNRSKVVLDRIIVGTEFKKQSSDINYGFDKEEDICFIVPYSIYGGAEVYLKNFIEKFKNINYKVFCLGNNRISEYIPKENLVMTSLSKLDSEILKRKFGTICFYNSKRVYDKILKFKNKIKIVEIYHSDFTWSDSMSNLEHHNVDWIIRISKNVGSHIRDIDKISSIVNPCIDFKKFLPRSRDKSVIGTVARLSNEKNLEYLIELKKKIPDKRFVVFGDGSDVIKSRLLSGGIEVCGFSENIHERYNFGAFVLPSNKEGLPLTLIESLACNIPCFAKNIGGIPEALSNLNYDWEITGDPVLDSKKILSNMNKNFDFREALYSYYNSENKVDEFVNTILYSNKKNKVWSSYLNPNEYFDGIYCINLDHREDKWRKSNRAFNRWGLKVERYSARDPKDSMVNYYWRKLNYLEPNESIRRASKQMTKIGEVGCFISHFEIIKRAKEEGKKKILIFEDDVIFSKNFDKDIRFLRILQDDWAMIYLGGSQYDWKGVRPHSNKFYYSKNTDGTFAYAINLEYYDKIYEALKDVSHPIDWDYRIGIQNVFPTKCFTFFPNIVIADVSDSDIRGKRDTVSQAKILKWNLEDYET